MAQATFKAVVTDTLARRFIAVRNDREQSRQRQAWIEVQCCDAVNREIGTLARLMGVEADMDVMVEKIERANAKEAE